MTTSDRLRRTCEGDHSMQLYVVPFLVALLLMIGCYPPLDEERDERPVLDAQVEPNMRPIDMGRLAVDAMMPPDAVSVDAALPDMADLEDMDVDPGEDADIDAGIDAQTMPDADLDRDAELEPDMFAPIPEPLPRRSIR